MSGILYHPWNEAQARVRSGHDTVEWRAMTDKPRTRIPDGTVVKMGDRELVFAEHIFDLRDANDVRDDPDALRSRLAEDGYLLIRGFHDEAATYRARLDVAQELHRQGGLASDAPIEDVIASDNGGYLPDGRRIAISDDRIRQMSSFLELVNAQSTLQFCDRLLGAPTRTYTHKWIRIYQPGQDTEIHYDAPYMGPDGPDRVITTWTALGKITLDMGPLAIARGSHRLDALIRTYGKTDAVRGGASGWLTKDPFEVIDKYKVKWATTEFELGDMLMFGKYMLHGSLQNGSNRFRLRTWIETSDQTRGALAG